eukprot:134343_1
MKGKLAARFVDLNFDPTKMKVGANLSGKREKQEIDESVILNKAIVSGKKIKIAKANANAIIRGYCIMENQTEILFHEYILRTLFAYFFGGRSGVSSSIVYEIGAERMK